MEVLPGVLRPTKGLVFLTPEQPVEKVGSLFLITREHRVRNAPALPRMGVIQQVGEAVTGVSPGDRVLFNPFWAYDLEDGSWAVQEAGLYGVAEPDVVVEPLSISEQG